MVVQFDSQTALYRLEEVNKALNCFMRMEVDCNFRWTNVESITKTEGF